MFKVNNELLYDFLLDTLVPNTWWKDITIRPDDEISELENAQVILIDINGNFSVEKFKNKLQNFYQSTIQMVISQYGYEPFEDLIKKSTSEKRRKQKESWY